MSSVERMETNKLMSMVVVHKDVVYLAGQVGEGAGIAEQTAAILAKIDRLLALGGTDKSKLLTATIWLTHMEDFQAMNAVWEKWLAPGAGPARACVHSALAVPQYIVEIMVTAAKD